MDLTGELLTIRYVTLDQAMTWRWGENPKKHDLDALAASITRYGFRDPSLYDSTLPGIPAGNGRLEALEQLRAAEETAPRGVGLDEDGTWYVPIVFGVDAESQAMAQAFGIAHNNLTVVGFSAAEVARLWRQEDYIALLDRLAKQDALPVTVGDDDLAALLEQLAEPEPTPGSDGSLLALSDITIADPRHPVEPGEVWHLGPHILVCADVLTEWNQWHGFLVDGMIFAPFPGPFVVLTQKAAVQPFLLVQPDPYIAGHILDRYADVFGEDEVRRDA